MRCVLISQYFPPDMGGASARCHNVAKGLKATGWEVMVVTAMPHYPLGKKPARYTWRLCRMETLEGIRVVRLWVPPLAHDTFLKRLLLHGTFCMISLLAIPVAHGSKVVFASSPNFFVMFPAYIYRLALRAVLVRNVDDLWPEVFYELGLLKPKLVRRVVDWLSSLTYKMPHAVAAISPAYTEFIRGKYNVPDERMEVIEVGVDTEIFHPMPRRNRDEFVLMYSGILGPLYDFRSLLLAAKQLDELPDLKIVIRGVGEREKEIRSLINSLKLKNVRFETQLVEGKKLSSILNEANAFVVPMVNLPMADRGLPTKLFEYQALGRPIIVASTGESARFIRDTQSGIAVPPEDPSALANAILELYQNPGLAKLMGEAALAYVEEHVTVSKIGERMSKLFERSLQTFRNHDS